MMGIFKSDPRGASVYEWEEGERRMDPDKRLLGERLCEKALELAEAKRLVLLRMAERP